MDDNLLLQMLLKRERLFDAKIFIWSGNQFATAFF